MNHALTLWAGATAAHFALTGLWVHRLGFTRSRDEFWFSWTAISIGSLVAAIHITSLVSGLNLASGLTVLACLHGSAGAISWRARKLIDPDGRPSSWDVLETAAIAVLCGVVASWSSNASRSLDVDGIDAVNYHLPAAINLALGASLFGLPATPHLYPMVSSALVAWFILPLRDPLLIETAMLLPFMLLASAIAWVFRLVTGVSGLAWTPWLILALFSTPLFRAVSLVSADLMFAASFAALLAQLLALLGGSSRTAGLPLAGITTGLLLGSKTTGLPAAVLLWACFLLLRPFVGMTPRTSSWRRLTGLALVGVLLSVATGGIWLIRNWLVWDSPIAPTGLTIGGVEIFSGIPHETSQYLSVLGDRNADPAYDLWARVTNYVAAWLGSWYLVALLPAILVIVDAALAVGQGRWSDARMRVALVAFILGTGVPLTWLLAGAPWTSLEWTHGLSLRYVLPLAALLPLLALLGCFPSALPWFRRRMWFTCAGLTFAAWGIVLLARGQGSGDIHPPRLELLPLAIGSFGGAAILMVRRRARHLVIVTVLLILIAGGWAAVVANRDAAARTNARNRPTPYQGPDRAIYLKLLEAEQARGLSCASRRIFVLVRFDAPLELQSVEYRNQVFYASRDLNVTARAAPLTRCDYILATRPVIHTDKGQRLIATLNRFGQTAEIAEVSPFVLLGRR